MVVLMKYEDKYDFGGVVPFKDEHEMNMHHLKERITVAKEQLKRAEKEQDEIKIALCHGKLQGLREAYLIVKRLEEDDDFD